MTIKGLCNLIKDIIYKRQNTLLLVAVIAASCLYCVSNAPQESLHIVRTALDDQIPRIPVFSIPYLVFLPWLWGTVFYVWFNNRSFRLLAYSLIIVNLIAFCVYLTFQTYVPRDPVTSNDFFSGLLQFIYDHDQPYNALPSLHSALSAVVVTYFALRKSRWTWAFVATAVLIVISTLFTKQHFIIDALSGITLGVVATWAVSRFIPKENTPVDSKAVNFQESAG